ncbi:MAG TPA: Rieske 2Fe-2S domain-containing protein, partial [Ktedonobacterales bacterium]|nr:Rieske 2Fe-2S domain-containing protein [Ktedonobacterales bacterium]
HLHHDHFDPQFLREHVSKDTTVLLPDYPLNLLERALRDLGFTRFLYTKNGQAHEIDGLRVMIMAAVAPTDGPLGDSGLMVDDGEVRIFDQNDSRPVDLDHLATFGPFDAHFLQFSGAIWYPMVYHYPEKMLLALGRKKRENELARALRYAQQVGASFIVPSAGPPCFLDDPLFNFNDFDRDPTNTFPDQTVFIEMLQEHGMDNGRLMIPGSVATLTKTACNVAHPFSDDEVSAIFTNKRAYLEAYKARQQPEIDRQKASWPRGQVEILPALTEWFQPIMEQADLIAGGINGLILLQCGDGDEAENVILDFHQRQVRAWADEEWDYRFHFDRALIEYCIIHHLEDWVNNVFLSCRFEAERRGAYNDYIYNFFKCLTPERIQYAEGYYSQQSKVDQFWEAEGYRIQRRCPHLKADLTRFARIEDGVLTCTMHGWQFELATGRCLTSDDRHLYAQPLTKADKSANEHDAGGANGSSSNGSGIPGKAPPVAVSASATPAASSNERGVQATPVAQDQPHQVLMPKKCGHCWYAPSDLPPMRSAPGQDTSGADRPRQAKSREPLA